MRSHPRSHPSVYYQSSCATVDMSRPSSPGVTAIDLNFNQRQLVNLRAENVSYTVNAKKLSLFHRLGALQLPWEWIDNNEPQQVLDRVSFAVKSGQMLAILGTSGTTTFLFINDLDLFALMFVSL